MPVEPSSGSRTALLVIGSLVVLSVVLGLVATRNYDGGEQVIDAEIDRLAAAGRTLEPMGCVAEVVGWKERCSGPGPLCEMSQDRLMEACLGAADRAGYCATLGPVWEDTSFGAAECRQAGLDAEAAWEAAGGWSTKLPRGLRPQVGREAKKACAGAWRALAVHCQGLAGGAPG